jgi:hypothetical protein
MFMEPLRNRVAQAVVPDSGRVISTHKELINISLLSLKNQSIGPFPFTTSILIVQGGRKMVRPLRAVLGIALEREVSMAANRQQGNYLALFLSAFVILTAGLVEVWEHKPVLGVALTLVGIVGFVVSLLGFRRIKGLEFSKD